MIIEIEGCKFRIRGADNQWAVEFLHKRGNAETWEGKYYFPALKWALDKARELILEKSPETARGFADVIAQVDKANAKLLRAVERAVRDGE